MIGVIGCGNMASAIVKGIHSKFKGVKFLTYTPSFTRAEALASDVRGQAVRTLKELNDCHTLLIACKPQQFNDLAQNLKNEVDLNGKLIISVMAAISTDTISQKLGTDIICRVMPNTPALVGQGVSLLFYSDKVNDNQKASVEAYFSSCSKVHELESEELFDKVTVVTGSGPAYVFYFAKTMVDSLISWGIEETEARKMVTQLFNGSVQLMQDREDKGLGELIDEVTSKKGVTIEAINCFKNEGLEAITHRALNAAYKRSLEIKAEL